MNNYRSIWIGLLKFYYILATWALSGKSKLTKSNLVAVDIGPKTSLFLLGNWSWNKLIE